MVNALPLPARPQIASPALSTAPQSTVASKCGNVCVATGTKTVTGTTIFAFPVVAAAKLKQILCGKAQGLGSFASALAMYCG